MKHESESEHDADRMGEVVTEALAAALEGAEREGLCTGCALRSTLSSVMMTIIGNEPETTDEEFLDMIGEMVAAALLARARHLIPVDAEGETVH